MNQNQLPAPDSPIGEYERMELYRQQKETCGSDRVLNKIREMLKLKEGDSVFEAIEKLTGTQR